MRIFLLFLLLLFSHLQFAQPIDSISDKHSIHTEEQESDSFEQIISLGHLIIDFDNNYNHYYYGPTDLYLLPLAHPRMGIEKFIDGYMYSLFINPKYLPLSVSTSLSFTVYPDGSLGNFMLGKEVNKNDTIYVETLLEMGPWMPSKQGKSNRFKLNIDSKDRIQDRQAQFPGGLQAFNTYVKKNLRFSGLYKNEHVIVEFFVEVDGSITGSKILKGIREAYEREALRIIDEMPKWIPGTQNGIPFRERVERWIIFEYDSKQKRIKN